MTRAAPGNARDSHGMGGRTAPAPPAAARVIFGDRLGVAVDYVELLAGAGTERGLLGPREVPRLWNRHIVNSAVVAELVDEGSTVADVGSGAGLPGLPMAIARPDLRITLIEPLLRRSEFLSEIIAELGIDRVTVTRSRAEDLPSETVFDVVTARAVAPMTQLAAWTLPLVRPGGVLLAIKGRSVFEELEESAASLARMGAVSWTVEEAGTGLAEPATRVAVVRTGQQRREPGRRNREGRKKR